MKEAAGEANLTVIAIILIGVIAAVVTPLVNSYMTTTARRGCCQNYGGVWKSNDCYEYENASSTGTTDSKKIDQGKYWDHDNKQCKDDSGATTK